MIRLRTDWLSRTLAFAGLACFTVFALSNQYLFLVLGFLLLGGTLVHSTYLTVGKAGCLFWFAIFAIILLVQLWPR